MASKTNAGLMSASDKQRIDGLNAEFKTRDDKITKNAEDIKSWNDEMINKEYQYFNGQDITIDNSIVSKTTDMIIKGSTLQNMAKLGSTSNVIGISDSTVARYPYYYNLKNNTDYTIIFEIENKTDDNQVRISLNAGTVGSGYDVHNGINVLKIRSANEFNTEIWFYYHRDSVDGSGSVKNIIVLEGDLTNKPIPPYFEGIKSFGEQEDKISILSHGINLCEFLEKGGMLNNNFNDYNNGNYIRTNYINIESIKSLSWYLANYKDKIRPSAWYFYDRNKMAIKPIIYGNAIVQVPQGAKFVRVELASATEPTDITEYINVINFMVVNSDKVYEQYIPYQSNKKDILLQNLGFDEGLRGFNLTICDELNDIKNVAIKKIEKYIFNGNENLRVIDASLANCLAVRFNLENIKADTRNVLCNNFCYELSWNDKEHFFIERNIITFIINKTKLISQDVEGFKAWLKANPTTIIYELAEPVIIPFDKDINLKTFNERTYITSDNIIKGDLSFTVPMNTAANLENNTTKLNTIEDYVDNNKDNKNKISKLEEGAVTSSLNIIDLQKEIINKDDYIKYEDKNIFINKNKEMQICNTIIKGDTLVNHILTPFKDKVYYGNSTSQRESYKVSIKPNTKYTIIADVVENSLNNNFSIIS